MCWSVCLLHNVWSLIYSTISCIIYFRFDWNMIKFWKVWFIIVPFNSLCQNSILLYLSNLHYFIVSVQFTKQDHLDNLDSKCLIVRAPFSCRFKINYWLFWISSSQFQFWFHQIVLPLFWYFKFWTTNFGFFNRMNFLLKPIGVVIIIRNSYVHIFIPFRSLIHSTYHRHQQKHQHTSSLFSFQLISLLVSIDRHFNAMAKKDTHDKMTRVQIRRAFSML